MTKKAEIIAVDGVPSDGLGFRPLVNAEDQYLLNDQGRVVLSNGTLQVNSVLMEREWDRVDAAVLEHPRVGTGVMDDLEGLGLIEPMPHLGIQQSSYRTGSERRMADVNMDGRTAVDEDRQDRDLQSVPQPIVATAYRVGWRELEASRRGGAPIDTSEAMEAGQSVEERLQYMAFEGAPNVVVGANPVYGLTTHPSVVSQAMAASSLGGGDFGTIANIYPTFQNALATLAALRYRGPFGVYVSTEQFHELASRYNDGSGQTAMASVMQNLGPGQNGSGRISFIREIDSVFLPAGELVFVQLTRNVVDVAVAMGLSNREWTSPDGMNFYAKVMASKVLRIKKDFSGNVGILHVTGA